MAWVCAKRHSVKGGAPSVRGDNPNANAKTGTCGGVAMVRYSRVLFKMDEQSTLR